METFESELRARLAKHSRSDSAQIPAKLLESIEYSLLAPGKRIRPRLAIATGRALDLHEEIGICSGIAIEMVHCFSLIHDDLPCMDDDDERRGRPSNHIAFDESTALLAGDGLIALALDVLCDVAPHTDYSSFTRGVRLFSECFGPRGMTGGQAKESELNEHSSLEDVLEMHAGKTGALFRASIELPLTLSGLSDSDPKSDALREFSRAFGKVFQIADDLDDQEEDLERAPFTSVLNYRSKSEAYQLALSTMRGAEDKLEQALGTRSRDLIQLSEPMLELAKKRSESTCP